jgi:hypothetical protein
MTKLTDLKGILNKLPAGAIPTGMRGTILELVEGCWDELVGSRDTKMAVRKICRENGAENLTWAPPNLSFSIDRHGGVVLGSKRAERQTWTLNLEIATASPHVSGYRQLQPNSRKLDVTPFVTAICDAAQRGPASASDLIDRGVVEWRGDDEIRVKHSILIPNNGPNQTISGRRKRFRNKLKIGMEANGWKQVSVHQWITFKRR